MINRQNQGLGSDKKNEMDANGLQFFQVRMDIGDLI
jgi:hypothetical protein